MTLIDWVAFACVLASFGVIGLGFWWSWLERGVRDQIRQGLEAAVATLHESVIRVPDVVLGEGEEERPLPETPGEILTGLADLATSLVGASRTIQSLVIATVLLFFAASLAVVDRLG